MRNFVILLVGAGALVGSAGLALADNTTSSQTVAPTTVARVQPASASTANPDEIVCRSMAPPTGTRLGARRVCQSQRQWDVEREAEQQELMKAQTSLTPGSPGN